ncbi:MAG: N-acetylmuramoyl-L-alanine amidase [Chitinophagia bacterium]|jgi:N-acetylmuramoyl-L-alanine amidase
MKYLLLILVWVAGFCLPVTAQSYPIVRTTGKLPALYFGLGEDRLGGAKMGYIDSGVLLTIVDSAKDMYKVQLSANHSAYIEKKSVLPDSAIQRKKYYLTASMNAKGDSAVDYVGIAMEERLPYQTNMVTSPAAIELDIYGVQSNTNWVTQLRSLKEVKHVYYKQIEDDVVRVTIELIHRQHWGYSVGYKGKFLVVSVKRQPQKLDIRKLTIGIDAGHGGSNVGTGGIITKRAEKDLTLLYAKELQKWLKKKGVTNVIMSREIDTTFDNKDRILFFQQLKPDLLISLHFNSSANQQVRGVSTYYKHIGFRPLTQYVLNRMLELNLNEFGNIGHFNFALNAPTDFPNCLVEIAFLSNEEDERIVVQPGFRIAVAQKIYSGINDWLKSLK